MSVPSGIVRRARRPRDWTAPGPAPVVPRECPEAWPRAGEDLCYLTGDWRILQRVRGHRWSLDDLVTAWMACRQWPANPPETILDLGTGIGAVLLIMAWRFPSARLLGIEAQWVSVDLARRSLLWNGVAARGSVREGDFRDTAVLPERGVFDLVTGTPPYFAHGTATPSARVQWGPCHLEHRGGIEAYCRAAAGAMAPNGCFVTCAGGGQDARVAAAASGAGLTIARRIDVIPRAGKGALLAVYVMRAAATGAPQIDPPLIVRDAGGHRTVRFRALRAEMGMPP